MQVEVNNDTGEVKLTPEAVNEMAALDTLKESKGKIQLDKALSTDKKSFTYTFHK